MTNEELNLLIDEMILQKIPREYQVMLALSAGDSKERYERIMNWLTENRHKDYKSLDLINALNAIDDMIKALN